MTDEQRRVMYMRQKRKLKVDSKGITILEVLIAMVVLSISLLLLLNMAMVAADSNDWSNKTTLATQMLQDKIEQLRSSTDLSNGNDSTAGISRSWTVTNVGRHLRQVSVQVNWTNIKGQSKSNSVTALVEVDTI
jgi:Tfp pilus assembly protein PilV